MSVVNIAAAPGAGRRCKEHIEACKCDEGGNEEGTQHTGLERSYEKVGGVPPRLLPPTHDQQSTRRVSCVEKKTFCKYLELVVVIFCKVLLQLSLIFHVSIMKRNPGLTQSDCLVKLCCELTKGQDKPR